MFNKNKKTNFKIVEITKERLAIEEYGQFIDCVSGSVVFNNELHLENLKPVFLITCLNMFTSTPLVKTELDDNGNQSIDFNATYQFCLANDIISQIKNQVSEEYIEQLYSDCLETIEFKKNVEISMSSPLFELLTGLKNAVDNFNPEQYKDIIQLAQNANNNNVTKEDFIDSIVKNLPKKDNAVKQKDVK